MSKFKVGDEVCLKSKHSTKGEVTAHREGSGVRVKWEPNGTYGSHFEHELALLDSVLPNLGSSHKFKVGDEVGLVVGNYEVDESNPLHTKGVITKLRVKDGRISVDWDNGISNGYETKGELYLWEEEVEHTPLTKEWTDKHYNHYLTVKLTPEDIAAGEVKVKVDPYVVNEVWGINSVEKSGAGFHCLKTLSRMANAKNSLEREWDALIGQSTRARELLNK